MVHKFSTAKVKAGGKTPRQQERERKHALIVMAAKAMLAEEGVESLTLSKVAAEVGYVKTAIYRYFPSKDALLAAVHRATISEVVEVLGQGQQKLAALEETGAFPKAGAGLRRPLALALRYAKLPQGMPEHFRLVSTFLGDPRRLLSDAQARNNAPLLLGLLAQVQQAFGAAEESGELPPGDSHQRTLFLWSSVQGLLQLQKLVAYGQQVSTPEPLVKPLLATLLSGMGAQREQVESQLELLATHPELFAIAPAD